MATTSVKIEGFKELEKQLDNLSKAAGKGALRRSLYRAAQPLAELASSMAPERSGKLKRSIVVGAKLNGRQTQLHRRMFRDDRSSIELFVGPSYLLGDSGRHGHLLEFGTAPFINKGKFAGSQNPGITAQPFMRPAWDQDQRAMLERLRTELWKRVSAAIVRAERRAARGR